ncbi:MAG: inositol monophosphatase family protein [Gammaproteobacteria bacterium]
MSSARLSCTTPDMFTTSSTQSTFNKLKKAVQLTSFGGDAYAFGCLAAGYVDLILEAQLKFHDVAALIPIIQGAGGGNIRLAGQPNYPLVQWGMPMCFKQNVTPVGTFHNCFREKL